MQAIADFAVEPVHPRTEDAPPRSRLLFNRQPISTTLDGTCLDAQFVIGNKYLLILSDDIPYEETLRFYLLDASLRVVDWLELGAPYSPGVLGDLRDVGADRLEFSFAGNDRWQLHVRDAPPSWIGAMLARAGRGERQSISKFMTLARMGART